MGKKTMHREVYRRGFLGNVIRLLGWGFSLFMAYELGHFFLMVGERVGNGASRDIEGPASAIGSGMIIATWIFGAVILHLLALATRGEKRVIIEEIE